MVAEAAERGERRGHRGVLHAAQGAQAVAPRHCLRPGARREALKIIKEKLKQGRSL